MNRYQYDIVIVGAGHAGTEAAAAAARLGAKVALLTGNLDTVGQMSCNPAIGGVAKGQIVREIDALGGLMGQTIDKTGIQFRMLNSRKGPAMHSPRAQADKKAYQFEIKRVIEETPNLDLRQELVEEILTDPSDSHQVIGVRVPSCTRARQKRQAAARGKELAPASVTRCILSASASNASKQEHPHD
jgi:tRNA uridine 5-carboxymethylaminomethyl modification enzyme